MNKAILRKTALYLAGLILLLLLLTLLFRNLVFTAWVRGKADRFNAVYPAKLVIKSARIGGLASVEVNGISLCPESGDTLLKIGSVYASLNLWKLVAGRVAIGDVELRNTHLTLVRRDSLTNYLFFFSRQETPKSADTAAPPEMQSDIDWGAAADRITGIIFDKIPDHFRIDDFNVSGDFSGHLVAFHVDRLLLDDHRFSTLVLVREDSLETRWQAEGRLDNDERVAELRLCSADTGRVILPFLQYKWNAGIAFDTLVFSVAEQRTDDDHATFSGLARMSGMTLNHPRIAAQPVDFERLAFDFSIHVGANWAELDSSTIVTFNRLSFSPYARVERDTSWKVSLQLHKPPFPARELFSSFPEGLFTTLAGMKTEGELSFDFDFFVDLGMPDSLRFMTELRRHGFRVTSWGSAGLGRINEPFLYTAYERGEPVRSFMVGPENPDFRSIDRISPYLKAAVMTSEDGGFYLHNGFIADAFRESIIANIKARRFVRGGSTISMQLVKNVYLNRNKNIARKLEEALITWLIESQRLSTKDRMFEVYLNIIEWGPMIYGANEASRFYFNKDVSRLTLAEAIFMASVIPRPKWFRYSFDETGHLAEFNAAYYSLVAGKMLNKGWITQQDADRLVPDVELKGPAKLLLKNAVPVPADSLLQDVEQD
jgi:hypothetical protein